MTDTNELAKNLADRRWRLNNLYYITDKRGKEIVFRMNKQQIDYFDNLHTRNIILKSRQLGFTTAQCIIQLDAAVFEGAKCAMICHSLDDATRLFREKVKFAYDRLPKIIQETVPAKSDRAGELVFDNGGSLAVGTSFRGGTLRYLHISEFGKICAKYPDKAREIVTGAFEAVAADCVITIESTAEGRTGYFADYCSTAEKAKLADKLLGPLDWKFFFYPWHENEGYQLDTDRNDIPMDVIEYGYELKEKHGITVTTNQLGWYTAKKADLGDDMLREYPSTPEEAFRVQIEGAYYANQIRELYKSKQIARVPHQAGISVHTVWDLGYSDSTTVWFIQRSGREWHVIDYFEDANEGLEYYARVIDDRRRDRNYHYGLHIGPHDLKQHEFSSGETRLQAARKLGLNFTVAPKLAVVDGIEAVRRVLPSCWFDETNTRVGLNHLEQYRKEWNEKLGVWKSTPLHNEASHAADSFRYFATCLDMIDNAGGRKTYSVAASIPSAAWT